MKKTKFGMITLLAALVLGACGQSNGGGTGSTDTGESSSDAAASDISTLPLAVVNDDEVIEGGVLDVAVVMDTQFQGLFQWEFYQDAYDRDFMLPSHEYLFLQDEDFKIIDGGPADLDLDVENNKATITLRDELKWSDGVDVTAEDVIFLMKSLVIKTMMAFATIMTLLILLEWKNTIAVKQIRFLGSQQLAIK